MLKDKLGMAILVIPLAAAVISLFFLPYKIPLHFDITFTTDRYGSKYFILLLGLIPYFVYASIRRKYKI